MKLSSGVFEEGAMIPSEYTCSGENVSPPLLFEDLPEGTQSLALVMDDSDIPDEIKTKMGIQKFNHWVIYNIPVDTLLFEEGSTLGTVGLNTRGEAMYTGPCPPTEYEPTTHRYSFRLYALPKMLTFDETPTLDEVEAGAQAIMLEKLS
jgi:Raf kinase inhibitor-like YbhB/YbcL family protein